MIYYLKLLFISFFHSKSAYNLEEKLREWKNKYIAAKNEFWLKSIKHLEELQLCTLIYIDIIADILGVKPYQITLFFVHCKYTLIIQFKDQF